MLKQHEIAFKDMFHGLAESLEELSSLRSRNVELERISSEDAQTIAQLSDAKHGLESLVEELRAKLNDALSREAQLRSDLHLTQAQNVDKDREIADLQHTVNYLDGQMQQAHADLNHLHNELAHTSAVLAERQAVLDKAYALFGMAPPAPSLPEPVAEPAQSVQVTAPAPEVATPLPFDLSQRDTSGAPSPTPSQEHMHETEAEKPLPAVYTFGG